MPREVFHDVESAMAALPIAVERRAAVRQLIADIAYWRVWIPDGRQYVALAADGAVEAYINPGFVDVRTEAGDYDRRWLPGASGRATRSEAAGAGSNASRPEAVCPSCFTALPLTGVCDQCG